jgi:hypothetical protein
MLLAKISEKAVFNNTDIALLETGSFGITPATRKRYQTHYRKGIQSANSGNGVRPGITIRVR